MTFQEFQATRRESKDLSKDIPDACWDDNMEPAQGLIYLNCLYIEKVGPDHPDYARARGAWFLVLGNQDWITDDLLVLEVKLWHWAVDEGYEA